MRSASCFMKTERKIMHIIGILYDKKDDYKMKKNNVNYNINPILIAVGSVILTLINALFTNFGTVYHRNQFGRGQMSGSFLIIIFLLLPAFFEGYRKNLWSKKSLIILLFALIINLSLGVYCTLNRYKLFGIL